MNLDKKVWLVMFATALICIAFVSYSFVTTEKCTPFTVNIQGLTINEGGYYEVGEPLFFRASLATDKEIVWDFGDKSEKQKSRSVTVKHTYIKDGTYSVSALVNGTCYSEDIKVNIKEGTRPEKSGIKAPKILGNTSPKAGQPQTYISDLIGGTDYEWKILDRSTFPTINGQSANYTFDKPGIYRLQLTVDHDRNNKRAIIEINVVENLAKAGPKPAPPPIFIPPPVKPKNKPAGDNPKTESPAPEKTTAPKPIDSKPAEPTPTPVATRHVTQIGNRGFKTMLQSVVAGQTGLDEFDEFLVAKGNTIVRVNDESAPQKFSDFFNRIKGKKYTIEDVKLIHDPNDETIITRIEVQLKDSRGFFKKLVNPKQQY